MTRRQVRFTATARRHLQSATQWWTEQTGQSELIADEMEVVISLVAVLPGVGSPYPRPRFPEMRRLYLERLNAHIYYTHSAEEVTIRAFWHARRKSGPTIRP